MSDGEVEKEVLDWNPQRARQEDILEYLKEAEKFTVRIKHGKKSQF